MATFNADNMSNAPFNGGVGNNCSTTVSYTFTASSVVENSVINLCKIPAYSTIKGVRMIFDDCGTSVTMDVGYSNSGASSLTYFHADLDVATAAGQAQSASHPLSVTLETTITAKVMDGAFTGTPKITAIVDFDYNGMP